MPLIEVVSLSAHGAGYLAVSVNLCFWGRPPVCLLRMFRDLPGRPGRGTFEQVNAARTWLAGQPGCDGQFGVIGFCATGGFALVMAAGHGFSVSSVNYGLVRKDGGGRAARGLPDRGQLRGEGPGPAGRAAAARPGAARRQGSTTTPRCTRTPGHAFLNQSEDEPGMVVQASWRGSLTPGTRRRPARDARRRIIAFFDARLKV